MRPQQNKYNIFKSFLNTKIPQLFFAVCLLLSLLFLAAGCSDVSPQAQNEAVRQSRENKSTAAFLSQRPERQYASAVLEDDILSFCVQACGDVFVLPFPAAQLSRAGWQSRTQLENESLMPNEYSEVVFFKDNTEITVWLANLKEYEINANEGTVIMLSAEFCCKETHTDGENEENKILLPAAFGCGSSREDFLQVYGKAGRQNGRQSLKYMINNRSYAEIYFDENEYADSFCIMNFGSTQSYSPAELPAAVSGWQPPNELPEAASWHSLAFELEEQLYSLPAPLHAFLQNGWEFADEKNAEKTLQAGGALQGIYLQKGSCYMRVNIKNTSTEQQGLAACFVSAVYADENSKYEILFSGGIGLQSSSNEVKQAYGNEFTSTSYSGTTSIIYHAASAKMTFEFENFGTADEKMTYLQLLTR